MLFIIEDTFSIRGRGLVVVPGIIPRADEAVRIGDPLLLKRPDGTSVTTAIGGMDIFTTPTPRLNIPILLEDLDKDDVPVGTEVWSVDRA
jgi:hypothetical protein